ncbi:MAG: DNA topoisomerase III [Leptospirales bacterium]
MRLFIAEKPSMARNIAECLDPQGKKDGYIEIKGGAVSWCVGHILSQAPPDHYDPKYREWNESDLPIIPSKWRLIVSKGMTGQLGTLKKLLSQADEIVNAGDPDREGQLIVDEVLEYLGNRKPVRRLWLASLDTKSVREALTSMKSNAEFTALRESALARSRADWLVGMNLSRSFTARARRGGFDKVVSVGRVQTPTLSLVVSRDREIESFVPKDYFVLTASVKVSSGTLPMAWSPSPDHVGLDPDGWCVDRTVLVTVARNADGKSSRLDVETKRKKESPPLPFSLSGLTAVASKRWGYSAKEVLDAAQTLYERKLTTYPRTDCEYLPENQYGDTAGLLKSLGNIWKEARNADPGKRSKAWNTEKITAHHAIIPTSQAADPSSLGSKILSNLYDLIVRHYIAQFYPDFTFSETTVKAVFAGEPFRTKGRIPLDQGWKAVFSSEKDEEDEEGGEQNRGQTLPALQNVETGTVSGTDIQSKKTTPPARFTDGTLILAMKSVHRFVTDPKLKAILKENEGIGTEATRASIIEILLKREFLKKVGKKNLVSTPSGRALIDLVSIDVKSPGTTALWERDLESITSREKCEDFVSRIGTFVSKIVDGNRTGESGRFSGQKGSAESHPCPSCGRPLSRIKGPSGFFWGCAGYRDKEKPCKTTCPDERGNPGKIREARKPEGIGPPCPKCGKATGEMKTKMKIPYFRCPEGHGPWWSDNGGLGKEWVPFPAKGKSGPKVTRTSGSQKKRGVR